MVTKTYEAYEDNSGRIYIYALDGARPVWGQTYYGNEDEAGQDWCGLMVQGLDPLREGWEGIEPDELEGIYYGSTARQIADSELGWDNYTMGVMLGECGEAGRLFAIAAGAAYRCPECGEVCQTVRDTRYPESWVVPARCECCGADLTDCEL